MVLGKTINYKFVRNCGGELTLFLVNIVTKSTFLGQVLGGKSWQKKVSVIRFKSHSWVAADVMLKDIGDGSSGTILS